MRSIMTKLGLGVAIAATALTTAAPAQAQHYRGGYHGYHGYHDYHRGGGDAVAAGLLGGIVGLGIGAAIADSNRGPYYDRGYAQRDYYDRGGYYDYAPPCYEQWRYDPYYHRNVQVRVCR